MIRNKIKLLPVRTNKGMSLVEVMVASVIIGIALMAIYNSVLWGRYRATKAQYVVTAANIGRHQMEIIKAMGYFNATQSVYHRFNVGSTLNNPNLAFGGTFARTNLYSLDTKFDLESLFSDDSSAGPGNVLRTFTVNVFLRPTNPAQTSVPPFNEPLATYVTYMTVGGI